MRVRGYLLAAAAVVLCGCATPLSYLAKQGRYLLRYGTGAKDADSLIASPRTDLETRDFLVLAREIRRFASDRIGLRENGSFTRYKEIDRDYLVSVVSARQKSTPSTPYSRSPSPAGCPGSADTAASNAVWTAPGNIAS